MRTVALSRLVRPAGKRAGETNGLNVYSVTKHAGFVPSLEYFKKQVFSRDLDAYRLVERGEFAYATIHLDEGSIGIAPERCLISPMYTVFDTDKDQVDPGYLIRFLKSPRTLAHYPQLGKGAIHRRKAISLNALGTLPVPLPPLPEQRRIAAILDHADALRAKRRQVLAHLDALTQSIFHDMFGATPTTTVPLGEVASFFGGASLPDGEPYTGQESGTLLMKVSDMNSAGNERAIWSASLWTSGDTPRSSTITSGAIVIPKRGASIATNKKRIASRRTALDPNLMGVQPDPERLTTEYLLAWFRSFDLASIASGSTVPQLNKQDLSPLPLPLPDLDSQRTLATRIRGQSALMLKVQSALAADDELFASLQSRAFDGRL